MNQTKFAHSLGVSLGAYQKYENGIRDMRVTELEVLAASYGVNLHWLIVGSHDDTKDSAIVGEISAEVDRATKKFPTWPTDPLHALAVLGEEYGELTKAMLQLTYEPHKTNPLEVRSEAIQTAAMAIRLAMSLNRYEYQRCPQHAQD